MDFLELAKTNIADIDWINDFNPRNLLNYEDISVNSHNFLDTSSYITAEECSTILLEKMKALRSYYVENLHSLKREYIKERLKYEEMHSKNFDKNSKDNILQPQQKNILKAYAHYHRTWGKLGDYRIRARNRRWQFVNFFGHTHKYLRKKYQAYLFEGYNTSANLITKPTSSSSGFAHTLQIQCCYSSSSLKDALYIPPYFTSLNNSSNNAKKGSKGVGKGQVTMGYSKKGSSKGSGNHASPSKRSSGGGSSSKHFGSQTAVVDLNRCTRLSLPHSMFCPEHILHDTRQLLFKPCYESTPQTSNDEGEVTLNVCREGGGAASLSSANNDDKNNNIKINKCQTPILNISMFDLCPNHYITPTF